MPRWILYDTVTTETVTVPLNPKSMTSPFLDQDTASGVRSPIDGVIRARRAPRTTKDWTFAGTVRTQAHHDLLIAWAAKTNLLHITDHYGRTFAVRIRSIEMLERKATPLVAWRLAYTINCISYGEV